jgi:hypothetical protein
MGRIDVIVKPVYMMLVCTGDVMRTTIEVVGERLVLSGIQQRCLSLDEL